MALRWSAASRDAGVTVLELSLAVTVFTVLIGALFTVSFKSMQLLDELDVGASLQADSNRTYGRIVDVLRKSGRVTLAGTEYPRVVDGDRTLEFALAVDADGNGYPFDQTTGATEWDATPYVIKLDADGNLSVYRAGTEVYFLGRQIAFVKFATWKEDVSLAINEVSVSFEMRKTGPDGEVTQTINGSVFLRN